MDRKPVSDPELRELGEFQGTIDRNTNFRQKAFEHNLGRNIRVVRVLAYLAKMLRAGRKLVGHVECAAAEKQNFSSPKNLTIMGIAAEKHQAGHFLPGQLKIGGRPAWQFASGDVAKHLEFLFAEVEHLPASFNNADQEAEANGKPNGLCAAFANACSALIEYASSSAPPADEAATGWSTPPRIPHPNSPAASSFDWSSVGLVHPSAPASSSLSWAMLGLPHPDSAAGERFDFGTGLQNGSQDLEPAPPKKPPLLELVRVGFEVWAQGATAAFPPAIANKGSKPGIPPLVGNALEGYTEESITARSTASDTQRNRSEAVDVLEYYLQDQQSRTWGWVVGSCQPIFREIEEQQF